MMKYQEIMDGSIGLRQFEFAQEVRRLQDEGLLLTSDEIRELAGMYTIPMPGPADMRLLENYR